jgi:O-antigen/teichoic acid export membrane protein
VLAGLWLLRLIPLERADAAAVDAGAFWRFTGPRALTGVVQIALQRLDILLVGAMRGATAAAVYTAATRLVVVGQIATQAVWFAVQPHLAMLVASDDVDDARGLYRISTAWLVALTWPVFLASLVAAPEIMRLFGHGYSSGASSMAVLAVAMLVSGACGIVDVVLITVGKTATSLANTALALGVNVALDLALIPELGVLGAAIGWAVAIVVRNVAALVQVRRYGDFRPLSGLAVRVAGEAAVCFAAAPALALLVFGSHPSVAVAAVGVGALAYGVRLSRIRRELHLDIV